MTALYHRRPERAAAMTDSPPRRRWFRFSLWTLFVVVTICGVLFAYPVLISIALVSALPALVAALVGLMAIRLLERR